MKRKVIPQVSALANRFTDLLQHATEEQVTAGVQWYRKAGRVASTLDRLHRFPSGTGAALISALSPRMPWRRNIRVAVLRAQGKPIKVMRQVIKTANAALRDGIKALNGPKTRSFALAISGDTTAVVVDVWMMRAAGLTDNGPNVKQYAAISAAVAIAAQRTGYTPRDAQAILWTIVRGSAQ